MTDRVRIGMVGTSWWADWMHLPSIKSDPRAELVAICGRTREAAESMAQKYDIPQVYTDYREMFARSDLQAVVIATPDDLHYPIAMDALEAGLHVLCEKPLALNVDQARAIYERAEARGVKHMTFFTWRWMPHYQYARQLIESGYIGRPLQCQLRFLGGYGRNHEYAWRFDQRRANGILGDLGAHMIDLARLFVGDIVKVSAHVASFYERPATGGQAAASGNDGAILTVEFANGAHGTIHVSGVTHVAERQMEQQVILYGEAGTLEMSTMFDGPAAGEQISGVRSGEERFQKLTVPEHFWSGVDRSGSFDAQILDLFAKQSVGVRLFIDAILADQPVAPSFYDGLKAQQVIDAALESHRAGRHIIIAADSAKQIG